MKKVFSDSELQEDSVIRNFRITDADRKSYNTKYDNLAAVISVCYEVNSERAVQFRKWANQIVKDYTIDIDDNHDKEYECGCRAENRFGIVG